MRMLLLWADSFLPLTKLIVRNLLDLMQNCIMRMPVSIVNGLTKLCDQLVFAREITDPKCGNITNDRSLRVVKGF